MKISIVGMGKLGMPVGLAWATKHKVVGYDVYPHAKKIFAERHYPHREEGAQVLLESTSMTIVDSVEDAVEHGEIVFVAVQTPHQPEFEGITRMPEHRADFDYTALKAAVGDVAEAALRLQKQIVLVVISTVLPGTTERELRPILKNNSYVSYVYSPMFIAMGTTIADALKPEMVLVGVNKEDSGHSVETLRSFYKPLHEAPLQVMKVASAELTKVAYNVFLGLKIVAANAVMEIAHKIGDVDCDEVTDALAMATDRVISSKYMRGGGGDSGGCHPRDQIALSWLAQEHCLSFDLFDAMINAREEQTAWLAELCVNEATVLGKKIVVLGTAYKKGTNLTIGSYTILLKNILDEFREEFGLEIEQWDPHVDLDEIRVFVGPTVFIIGTNHDEFYDDSMVYPKGSTVIDPWGKMKDREGIKVVRVGRK